MKLTGKEDYLSRPQPPQIPDAEKELVPFIIAIDTREQHPFRFDGLDKRIYTNRQTLRTGDYSIVGMERRICVERKSKMDLFGSVIQGRDRFERELRRMAKMERACVIVECTMDDVKAGIAESQVDPLNVVLTAISWAGRYRVPWFFMHDRREAEKATFDFLRFAWRDFTTKKGDDRENPV